MIYLYYANKKIANRLEKLSFWRMDHFPVINE